MWHSIDSDNSNPANSNCFHFSSELELTRFYCQYFYKHYWPLMSFLCNQMRFSKTFFTFQFTSEYSLKNCWLVLSEAQKLFFAVDLMTTVCPQKTVKIQNPKTYDCWDYQVLFSWKFLAQTDKNCKTSFERDHFMVVAEPPTGSTSKCTSPDIN